MSVDIRDETQTLADLITRIERDIKAVKKSSGSPGTAHSIDSYMVSFSRDGMGGLFLTDEDAKEYRGCVDGIYAKVGRKTESISRAAIASFVQSAMLKSIDILSCSEETHFEKRLAAALVELRNDLKASPLTWEIHVPVDGLETEKLPCRFGGCTFYFGDDNAILTLSKRLNTIFGTVADAASQDEFWRRCKNLLGGRTCVWLHVEAVDESAARSLARKVLRNTVDVLSFFANLGGQPRSHLIYEDDARPGVLNTVIFSEELEIGSWPSERIGPVAPFSFAHSFLENAGFSKASQLLGKSKRSEFEERIISALQWAGRASVENRNEEAFLLFAISLESLLMDRDEKSEVTEILSVRASHVIGTNPSGKHKIYKEMKQMYRRRSQIVHRGSVEVEEDELNLIRYFARFAILTMLTSSRFSNIATDLDLIRYFRARMLA